MTENTNQDSVKRSQRYYLLGLTIIVFLGLIGLYHVLKPHSPQDNEKKEKSHFASVIPDADANSIILEKTEKRLKILDAKTERLTEDLKELSDQLKENNTSPKTNDDMARRFDDLERRMAQKMEETVTVVASNNNRASFTESEARIREDILPLQSNKEDIPDKNPDTYVPAGTFVQAVMLGGADASAAVNSSANPVPMLFRITAEGTLPNHKKSHLKDCVVTAAVQGDISSERGLIRLENLSCTFKNNEIVDQKVEGTIFGPEGKNGVRGIPLWREGALLQRAFAAGALSGIENGISETYTTNSISADGNVQTVNPSKVFQVGAANGAGKAMDKLADYNIQRAEQYHPVIQLSAGTVVDVVFLKGFYLDGKSDEYHTKSTNEEINKESKEKIFANTAALFSKPNNIPLTDVQVNRFAEHNRAFRSLPGEIDDQR